MKGKIFLYSILSIIIMLGVFFIAKSMANDEAETITEYVPQEEISEEQERQTLVSLYFQNKDSKNIQPEARLIDAKLLLINPCETIINLLLKGPKSENMQAIIPENTKLLDVKIKGNTAVINFSEEINMIEKQESIEKIKKSIKNTLMELNEIDDVEILANGKNI